MQPAPRLAMPDLACSPTLIAAAGTRPLQHVRGRRPKTRRHVPTDSIASINDTLRPTRSTWRSRDRGGSLAVCRRAFDKDRVPRTIRFMPIAVVSPARRRFCARACHRSSGPSVNASPSAGALPESRCATHATGGLFTQASPRRTRRARSPSRRVPVDTARLSVRLERRHHRPVPTPSSWARPLRVLRALLALRALRGEIPDRPCDCLGPRMNRIYRIGVGALGRQRGTRLAIHVAAPPPAMLGARPRWAPDGTRDRSEIRITTSPRRRPGSRCRRSPPVGSPRAPRRVASVRLGTRSVPDRAA